MIRRIGIDFGTSTTVLQVKNYESDGVTPVGDRIDTKDVKFGKQSYCDTYVKQKQDRWYFGISAPEIGNAIICGDQDDAAAWVKVRH